MKRIIIFLICIFFVSSCDKEDDLSNKLDSVLNESTWVGNLYFTSSKDDVCPISISFDSNGYSYINVDRNQFTDARSYHKLRAKIGEKSIKFTSLYNDFLFSGLWLLKNHTNNEIILEVDSGNPLRHRIIKIYRVVYSSIKH